MSRSGSPTDPITRRGACPPDAQGLGRAGSHRAAAATAIPGVVFAGAFDGHLRAYSADNGEVIRDYDTNRSFDTVSGEVAKGGSVESDGPVVVDDQARRVGVNAL